MCLILPTMRFPVRHHWTSPSLSNGCIWWATLLNSQEKTLLNRNELLQMPHPPPQVSSPFPQNAWKRTCQHPMQMLLFLQGTWMLQKQMPKSKRDESRCTVIVKRKQTENEGMPGNCWNWRYDHVVLGSDLWIWQNCQIIRLHKPQKPTGWSFWNSQNRINEDSWWGNNTSVLMGNQRTCIFFGGVLTLFSRLLSTFDKGRYASTTQSLARHLQQRLLLALRPGSGKHSKESVGRMNFQLSFPTSYGSLDRCLCKKSTKAIPSSSSSHVQWSDGYGRGPEK